MNLVIQTGISVFVGQPLQREDFEATRHAFAEALRNAPVQAPVVFQYTLRMGLELSLRRLGGARGGRLESAVKLSPPSTEKKIAPDAALNNMGPK